MSPQLFQLWMLMTASPDLRKHGLTVRGEAAHIVVLQNSKVTGRWAVVDDVYHWTPDGLSETRAKALSAESAAHLSLRMAILKNWQRP